MADMTGYLDDVSPTPDWDRDGDDDDDDDDGERCLRSLSCVFSHFVSSDIPSQPHSLSSASTKDCELIMWPVAVRLDACR